MFFVSIKTNGDVRSLSVLSLEQKRRFIYLFIFRKERERKKGKSCSANAHQMQFYEKTETTPQQDICIARTKQSSVFVWGRGIHLFKLNRIVTSNGNYSIWFRREWVRVRVRVEWPRGMRRWDGDELGEASNAVIGAAFCRGKVVRPPLIQLYLVTLTTPFSCVPQQLCTPEFARRVAPHVWQ